MRQQVPESSGYPLRVPGLGHVHPGVPFEHPDLVVGCVEVPAGAETSGSSPEATSPASGDSEAPGDGAAPPDDPAGGEPSGEAAPTRRPRSGKEGGR